MILTMDVISLLFGSQIKWKENKAASFCDTDRTSNKLEYFISLNCQVNSFDDFTCTGLTNQLPI